VSLARHVAAVEDRGLIAIILLDVTELLVSVAKALVAGGIDVFEFTVTTPGAIEALGEARRALGDGVILGAGTVLDAATARAAIQVGARFAVSPILSPDVIATCRRYGIVSIPGAYSPTEMLRAWELGADLVKVFPASSLGPQFIKDVLAPLPQLRLVPTGGVSLSNVAELIAAGAAAVAVGSNLVSKQLVADRSFDRLAELAVQYREAVSEARNKVACRSTVGVAAI
jgi:2-dehydro-3-deoxyphosphogluconate aldolase / (4S)-4-hydroxy-2-oxoglutarate aldolase